MGNGDLPGRLDPFARFREASVGANGVNDGVGHDDLDFVYTLNEIFEGAAQVALAAFKESHGVGMAIDGGFIGEIVIDGDLIRAVPVDESFLDGFSFGVAADAALALVARKFRNFRIDNVVIHGLLRP